MRKISSISLLLLLALVFSMGTAAAQKKSKKTKSGFSQVEKIPDSTAEELTVPDPIGLVSDYGNLFSSAQEDTLSAIIKSFKDSTGDEIAVAAWDTLHVVPEEMDAYVRKLAQSWDVGVKDKNNGIIIAFSVQLRKIRIENSTGGLTDKEAWEVVHKVMLPFFANKDYYHGLLAGLYAVIKKLNAE